FESHSCRCFVGLFFVIFTLIHCRGKETGRHSVKPASLSSLEDPPLAPSSLRPTMWHSILLCCALAAFSVSAVMAQSSGTASKPTPAPTPTAFADHTRVLTGGTIAGIVVGGIFFVLFVGSAIVCGWAHWKSTARRPVGDSEEGAAGGKVEAEPSDDVKAPPRLR
ncbi:unnamed protein product, partial [Mycena citricolor]